MHRYRLRPEQVDERHYWDRVDRNLGIITKEEQETLRTSTVGIAGCGGMGGLVAVQLARIGVGYLKIADPEVFDRSNMNRQYGARLDTLGLNKAMVTAQEVRHITPDISVDVYADGICDTTVEDFVAGCDIICDEVEFFAVAPRLLLHRTARSYGITVFNCNVVGFGTRLFRFIPTGMTMEELLELDGTESMEPWVAERLVERLVPEVPAYIRTAGMENVFHRQRAPIFGGTPPLSASILINAVCFALLGGAATRPWLAEVPPMPAYLIVDPSQAIAEVRHGVWW